MASGRGAKFRDVLCFRKIHLEETAYARCKRQQVERGLCSFRGVTRGNSAADGMGSIQGSLEFGEDTRLGEQVDAGFQVARLGNLAAVQGSESLLDLRHTAVTMHVPEAADIHQDVEALSCPSVERAKGFVMAPAMPQPQFDDFRDPGFRKARDNIAHLPVGML